MTLRQHQTAHAAADNRLNETDASVSLAAADPLKITPSDFQMRQGPELPQGVAQPLKQNNCAAVTKTPTNQYLWSQLPQAALNQCLRVSRYILILQQSLHMLRWVEYEPQSTLRALQPLIRLK